MHKKNISACIRSKHPIRERISSKDIRDKMETSLLLYGRLRHEKVQCLATEFVIFAFDSNAKTTHSDARFDNIKKRTSKNNNSLLMVEQRRRYSAAAVAVESWSVGRLGS